MTTLFQFRKPDGTESELMSEVALLALAHSEVITEETPVREEGESWQPAWRMPELRSAFGLSGAARASFAEEARPRPVPEWIASEPLLPPGSGAPLPRLPLILGAVVIVAVLLSAGRALLPPPVAVTHDLQMQLSLRPGWRSTFPDADVELMANADNKESVILVGKVEILPDEPPMTLESFDFALTQKAAREAPDFEDLGTQQYQANGLEFLRHTYRATLSGRHGLFILTNTRTGTAFYRISATTSIKLEEKRRPDLIAISDSFRPR